MLFLKKKQNQKKQKKKESRYKGVKDEIACYHSLLWSCALAVRYFLSSLAWLVWCEPVTPDNPSVITCLVLLRSRCFVQLLRSSFAPTLQTDLNVKLVFFPDGGETPLVQVSVL